MRKILLYIYFCLLLFSSLPVYAAQVEELSGEAVITSEILNVRSGPSVEDEIRGTLRKDQVVEIVGFAEPDWYVIDYGGQPGYINGAYLIFTPAEEPVSEETQQEDSARTYLILGLSVGVLVVAGLAIYTFVSLRTSGRDSGEDTDTIPITDHDDINMHMGEVTYDTYRLDIDPSFFETTTIIPQPESIAYDEWSIDDKLEQASAQIAALQKEVEELKKHKTEEMG